ncbi:SDR family oxidoreductase [Arthrobacter nitrophenolicus]|uniref:SDR family oxidoreductase n=1 Tax=Arthrobacter nitrophenolicus TaxID=683150 RepID=A0A4R5XQY4_9MICC|nr:SDR family oxidoreductase [Arthrobacter nitrophenolicus]
MPAYDAGQAGLRHHQPTPKLRSGRPAFEGIKKALADGIPSGGEGHRPSDGPHTLGAGQQHCPYRLGFRSVGTRCWNPGKGVVTVVSDENSAEDAPAAASAAVDTFGSLDVVVDGAGFTRDARTRMTTEGGFDDVISVLLERAWLGTRAAAEELAFAGIRVNAIQPGIIRTEKVESLRPDVLEKKLSEIPLTLFSEPTEVAGVALFLASGISNYMTGTILEITGGPHA